MSHELRTPLNAIIGFARLVRRRSEGVLPERDTDNLGKILTSGEQLLSLINDILDLSRIEAGRHRVEVAHVDVSSVVNSCAATIEPLLRSDDVVLVVEIESGIGSMMTDEEKLRQILINLLSNAIKFTERGSVMVSASTNDGRVRFSVADTGVGIAPDALELVFEEFHQEHSDQRASGTGLGLTISRQLARLLGGNLTASSEPGVGSTFTLDLPRRYQPDTATAA